MHAFCHISFQFPIFVSTFLVDFSNLAAASSNPSQCVLHTMLFQGGLFLQHSTAVCLMGVMDTSSLIACLSSSRKKNDGQVKQWRKVAAWGVRRAQGMRYEFVSVRSVRVACHILPRHWAAESGPSCVTWRAGEGSCQPEHCASKASPIPTD
jgi:hypothetical protein